MSNYLESYFCDPDIYIVCQKQLSLIDKLCENNISSVPK